MRNQTKNACNSLSLSQFLRIVRRGRQYIFTGLCGIAMTGCPSSFEGQYRDPTEVEILDEYWNETDARKTAETMIKGVLGKPWLQYHQKRTNQRPVVIVDTVENRTDEHIDTKALTDFIQDELINSGRVRFVNKAQRETILKEVKFQNDSGMVSANTAKRTGRQVGADFILTGAISNQTHRQDGVSSKTYQTNLILTNLETSEIEWSDRYVIKKKFERSGAGL